jgi:CubicO group peptidase (beta-lactamase class C family)
LFIIKLLCVIDWLYMDVGTFSVITSKLQVLQSNVGTSATKCFGSGQTAYDRPVGGSGHALIDRNTKRDLHIEQTKEAEMNFSKSRKLSQIQRKALVLAVVGASSSVHAGIWDNISVPNPTGIGYEGIRQTVDELAIETLKDADIPGLTVAVTQDGRLIYSRGFGFSNWTTRERMYASDRAPIGSTTKVITAMELLHWLDNNSGLPVEDAIKMKVYGTGGVLTHSSYRDAYTQGIRRHYPIVGIGIGRNNRVTAWFSDGKYTVGQSTDLDAYNGPQNFSLPTGKNMVELLGIARGGANNRVYSWYRDGTYSVGTVSDLDAFGGGTFESRRKDLILALAADTRTNTFYAYYHDGVVTSGDSPADLTNRWTKEYVTSGDQQRRYDIVGLARSDNDVMVAWYSNGKVTKGTSTNLVSTWAPRNYSRRGVPNSIAQWQKAYRNIEVRHLLSHTSGLTRSGQYDQARIKYDLPDYENSYRYSNQYVLSTRPLLFKPGQATSYSNHGMGLVGFLVEVLSGLDWYTYLRHHILVPSGATNIAPVGMYNDPDFDSRSHSVSSNGNVTVLPVESNSQPGSAAGALKASAADLLTLLVATDGLPNHVDVLSHETREMMETRPFPAVAPGGALGWQVKCEDPNCNNKRLWHNGKVTGGTSFMAKYLGDTTFSTYVNGIIVAVVANSGDTNVNKLKTLSNKIASEVAKVRSPRSFDLLLPVVQ